MCWRRWGAQTKIRSSNDKSPTLSGLTHTCENCCFVLVFACFYYIIHRRCTPLHAAAKIKPMVREDPVNIHCHIQIQVIAMYTDTFF